MSLQCLNEQLLDSLRFGQTVLTAALGNDAFGKIVDPLKIATFTDGKLTGGPQRGCHPFGQFQIPPSAAPAAFHIQ